jgi:hypothetical protein
MIMVMIVVMIMVVIMIVVMVVIVVVIMVTVMMLVIVFVVISVPIAPAGRIIAVIVAVTPVVTVIRRSGSRGERHCTETEHSGGCKGWCDERTAEACLFRHRKLLLWLARVITLPLPWAFQRHAGESTRQGARRGAMGQASERGEAKAAKFASNSTLRQTNPGPPTG